MRIDAHEIDRQYVCMSQIKNIIGDGKKAYILTFGCQQNEADSERLGGMAQEMGYGITHEIEEADLIVINIP